MKNKVVIFDLDDTLYKEIDFLKSAYREIAFWLEVRFGLNGIFERMLTDYLTGRNVFNILTRHPDIMVTKEELLVIYQNHYPVISLTEEIEQTLIFFKKSGVPLGLITDGRSVSQRNKIHVLHLMHFIEERDMVISEEFGSEKPDIRNYKYFESRYPDCKYIYVGDNVEKDFITPNRLGWTTVCLLDNGMNIHRQDFSLSQEYLPAFKIGSVAELMDFI